MATDYGGFKGGLKKEGWTSLAIVRAAAIICVTLPLASLQYCILKLCPRAWWPVAGFWHRLICSILGLRISVVSLPNHKGPVLYAINHISWVDIVVLGGHIKNASFIAKSEVGSWGVFGFLATLHKTVFVNRERRSESAQQRDALTDRIKDGHSLILFPEGTSTDGMRVEKFKSALFSVAEKANEASKEPLVVQPVTLAYTEVNGMPLIRSHKPWVAWLGETELLDHLRQLMGRATITVSLVYHPAITVAEAGNRKKLADYCETAVRAGLERANRAEFTLGPRLAHSSVSDETTFIDSNPGSI